VNYYAGTNAVGSGSAASQLDINRLGESLIRGLGPLIKDVETAVRQAAAQAHADATNGGGGSFETNGIVGAITNQTARLEAKTQEAISNFLAAATGTNLAGVLTNAWAAEIVGAAAAGASASSAAIMVSAALLVAAAPAHPARRYGKNSISEKNTPRSAIRQSSMRSA